MTPRQSFLLSLGIHVGLVIVLLVAGVLLAQRFLRPKPVEVNLLQTLAPGPDEGQGAQEEQEQPKPTPEKDPKIVERRIPEEVTYDPNKQIDFSNVPEVKSETPKPYEPEPVPDGGGDDLPPGGGTYKALIHTACYRNWTPPPLGALGRPRPSTEVQIVVERTGRILSHRITRASGNAEFDRTVVEAIDLSNPLPAFPPEIKGAQQTFGILFNLPEG
ncbi:MAG: TonB family protein [Verrucomicrobia bacterium]|nr:TonB family protein [Verrucomicrobiota bacterium]